jgi:hypothetical protein
MARPENPGSWDWSKFDGVWHRRPIGTTERWQSLTTTRIGTPPDNPRSKGSDNKQLPSIYRWDWKETR